MILLIDVGNTMTKVCLSNGRNLLMLKKYKTSEISRSIFTDFKDKQIKKAIISSVNNKKSMLLREILSNENIQCYEIKKEIKLSFSSEYDMDLMGSDRIVNIYTALKLYDPPFIIASIGTAFTIDYINSSKKHIGGMISAGPETLLKSLSSSADALFNISLHKTDELFEKNTENAINSGILNTYHLFLNGLREKLPENTKFILTGGFSPIINLENAIIFPELTLQGLLLANKIKC